MLGSLFSHPTRHQAFLLGALSRAVATVVLFPWIRVRKQLMAQQKQPQEEQQQHQVRRSDYGVGGCIVC